MFARTPRLLLRPGFPEDAPALAAAIADEAIVRNLATAPWPYRMRDAEAFLAKPRDPVLPSLPDLRTRHGAPQLVGSCGLGRRPSGSVELGYWIAMPFWGRGFATEAASAGRHRAHARASAASKARTSSTIRPRRGCSKSSASSRSESSLRG